MELYLDNFRGFEKQYIELNDVNFLVGENSTGKTTLLGLLSLFSEKENFWDTGFKNEYVDFGLFNEIVSKSKRTNKKFVLGFKKGNKLKGPKFVFDEVVAEYEELDGFPLPFRVSLKKGNLILIIKYEQNNIIIAGKLAVDKGSTDWIQQHVIDESVEFKKELPFLQSPKSKNMLIKNPEYAFLVLDYKKDDIIAKWAKVFNSDPFMKGASLFNDYSKQIWIDPVRSKPKRIYEPQNIKYSPEGEHTPTLLRDILLNNTAKQNKSFIAELQRFGKASGLFDEVKIDQYRKSKDSPFSLLFRLKNKDLKISNIGYGISQVLPILTEILYASEGSSFLIQQPEVHLHPRSQAYFGEFVFNQLVEQKKKFVIETHSDYLIDRFRLQVRKKNGQVYKKTNILFFETDGVKNKVTKIAIDKNGDYVGEQPQKFREFFLKEEMELLGL